tara:strand:+ start:3314 stop:3436 length:123 start_codon:yes stop_codon:yes gene_type:complete
MTKERTISYQEHYVLIQYYQDKIRELEAKLEVSQANRITI